MKDIRIIWDQDKRIIDFVANRVDEQEFLKPAGAIGIEKNGELIGGVVYDCYTGSNVMMHVASGGNKNWLHPAYLYFCFAHPFNTLKCNVITGLVREDNKQALDFDINLGFKHTGRLPQACSDGTDILILTMLKQDCRYLKDKYRGLFLQYLQTIA